MAMFGWVGAVMEVVDSMHAVMHAIHHLHHSMAGNAGALQSARWYTYDTRSHRVLVRSWGQARVLGKP